jgi:hypothetical protein
VEALHLQLMTEPTPVETVAPPSTIGEADRAEPFSARRAMKGIANGVSQPKRLRKQSQG